MAKPSEGKTSGNPKTPENQRTILLMHEKRANNFFSWNKLDHHARKVLHQGLNRAIQIWPHPHLKVNVERKKKNTNLYNFQVIFTVPGYLKPKIHGSIVVSVKKIRKCKLFVWWQKKYLILLSCVVFYCIYWVINSLRLHI